MFDAVTDTADGLVVVTGGSSGLGAAIVEKLRQESRSVAILARSVDNGRASQSVWTATCDVRDANGVRTALDRVEADSGLHTVGLVNAAGIVRREDFLSQGEEDWRDMLDTNFFGTMRMCQEVARRMEARKAGGSIVNIASVAALISLERRAAYSASKAAVVQFTRCLALELAGYNIRVNVVCPGAFQTPMTAEAMNTPEQRSWYENRIPLGRIGGPAECAPIVSFLLSGESRYMTGAVVSVDGGWSVQ